MLKKTMSIILALILTLSLILASVVPGLLQRT